MLTYHWKCTVLHCNHLGNTWKPLVLMTRHFDYCPRISEADNQSVRSSAPVVSRCFPGGYNVKLYISRGRLAWWLLFFLHSGRHTTPLHMSLWDSLNCENKYLLNLYTHYLHHSRAVCCIWSLNHLAKQKLKLSSLFRAQHNGWAGSEDLGDRVHKGQHQHVRGLAVCWLGVRQFFQERIQGKHCSIVWSNMA